MRMEDGEDDTTISILNLRSSILDATVHSALSALIRGGRVL